MLKYYILLHIFLFTSNVSRAQNVISSVHNASGTSSTAENGISLTYSVGELASIEHFIGNNQYSLSTGFLQMHVPLVTSISTFNFIDNNRVSLMPNPTIQFLQFQVNFNQIGILIFKILDATSSQKYVSPSISVSGIYNTKLDLGAYPAGVYYIKLHFQANKGNQQQGIYKIIKL